MQFQFLTIWDLFLTPIFILVFAALAKRQRDKNYPKGHPLHPYFMPGLYVKFGGAILIGFLYTYYYVGGDTFNYFNHARIINSADSLGTWLKLMTHTKVETDPKLYEYVSQMEWYNDSASYTVARIVAVCGLFNATNYMPIAIMFAYFSFQGIWALYRTFTNLYPTLTKELAFAFLFIPSVVIWGSSIFKDTICMFGLGWLTYTTFRLFINRDFSLKNIFYMVLSFMLIAQIKIYILMGFVPALFVWLLLSYSKKIPSLAVRWLMNLFFIGITIGGFLFFAQKFAGELDKYSLNNIAQTAAATRGWISYASEADQGSTYDLGDFDPSIGGMLKKFPQAVVVTLFRPFPWETRKIIVFFSALEALVFVYFTFKVLSNKVRIGLILKEPTVLFCLVFSLIFAFAVGISSYNFGALSRYKIPCMPFYAAFLIILINYKKVAGEEVLNAQENRERKRTELAPTL